MTKHVVFYIREASDGQSLAAQLLALTEVARTRQWEVVHSYVDHTINYRKDKNSGEGFRELCEALQYPDFDLVMVFSIDRLGRSLQGLASFLSNLQSKNIDLYLHKQGIDTTSSERPSFFFMSSIFAEFEKSILKERVNSGLKRARLQGTKLGRPRVSSDIEKQILNYRSQGMAIKTIAKELKTGVSVVQRVLYDKHPLILES